MKNKFYKISKEEYLRLLIASIDLSCYENTKASSWVLPGYNKPLIDEYMAHKEFYNDIIIKRYGFEKEDFIIDKDGVMRFMPDEEPIYETDCYDAYLIAERMLKDKPSYNF